MKQDNNNLSGSDNMVSEELNNEDLEVLPVPYKITYDGSDVISSHPINSECQNLIPVPGEAIQDDQNKNAEEPSKETDQSSEVKELLKQINTYQQMLGQLLTNVQKKAPEPDKKKSELDVKLEEFYHKAKQDAVNEVLNKIESDQQFDKKVKELRNQNPDIANDPVKEDIVGSIAIKYILTGMDFDTSIANALKDFRKASGQAQEHPKQNALPGIPNSKYNYSIPAKSNIPRSMPDKTPRSNANPFIEGSSPSIPEQQFKASELIDMQINRPQEYLRLQPRIMQAYKEGRVIFD